MGSSWEQQTIFFFLNWIEDVDDWDEVDDDEDRKHCLYFVICTSIESERDWECVGVGGNW